MRATMTRNSKGPDAEADASSGGRAPSLRTASQAVLVGAAYYGAAKLGLELSLVGESVTPLWPPTGIALVGFLTFGYRIWPGIAAAALLVNLPISPHALTALTIAAGNTLAPVIAGVLLSAVRFRRELDRARDAVALVVGGALVAMLVSASIGTAALLRWDAIEPHQFISTFSVWWTGDAMGVLAVAPFLLCLRTFGFRRPFPWLRALEGIVVFGTLGVVSYLLQWTGRPIWVVVFPLLGLTAWRFQQRGAAPAALGVATVASWAAARDLGPFADLQLLDKMVALQAFNAAVAFTSFFFAAVVAERLRAQGALQRSANELEAAVRLRTGELEEVNTRLGAEIVEREAAETTLRQRESQLAEAQEVARLGSWEWDIATNTIAWSDELYRIYGLEPQGFRATYEGFIERVHPDDRARAVELIDRALHEGLPFSDEHRILRSDGTERTVQAHGRVVTDPSGTPVRMLGTALDVTEQSVAESALRESEEVFRTVFESAAVGMAQCDFDGRVLKANLAFQRLLSCSEEELGETTLGEIAHQKDRARFEDLFQRMVSGPIGSFEIEMRLRRKAGGRVWVSASVSLVRGADGQARLIQVILHDLSERRRAEALQRAEDERARLRTLFAQVPAAVLVTKGPDHIIEFANAAFMQLVGARDFVGRPVRDALPEIAGQGYFERMDEVFADGRPFVASEALLSLERGGEGTLEEGYFNFVFQPLASPDGETEGILVHGIEVTEAVRSRLQVTESLAFLDTLLATAPAGFAVFDEDQRFIRVNERLALMTGVASESHLGRTLKDVVPDVAGDLEATIRAVAVDRRPQVDIEISRAGAPGEVTHWLASLYPIENRDGAILGVGAVVVDITERKRIERLLEAQKDVLELVARGTDLPAALDALARLAEGHTSGDVRGSILLLDEHGRLRHGAAPSISPEFFAAMDGLAIGPSAGSCGAAASSGKPEIVADIATHPTWTTLRHLALAHDLRAAWSSPILGGDGKVLGTFCMYCTKPRPPAPQERQLLEVLTQTAAVAIERQRMETERVRLAEREREAQVELYEREHRIAETLQRSLLPDRLPDSPDVQVVARYVPATSDVDVGGDWYDIIPLPDGTLGLAIGDVAGHGVSAAAAMGQLRMALRAYALENLSPAHALDRLNRLLHELQPGAMATLAYAHLDPETGLLTLAKAGHPPPMILGPDGSVDLVEGGLGPPLGVAPLVSYREVTAKLPPDATILLYTDGLIERRGESIDEGMARLERALRAASHDLETAADELVERLLGGDGVADDTALLAARRVSLAGRPLTLRLPALPARLAPVRRILGRWLRQNGFRPDGAAEVVTACTEACSNAMQHAYGSGEGWIEIDATIDDDDLTLRVRDHGSWKSPARREEGEGGRGLGLIQGLMDAVEVISGIEGTEVRMRRRTGELIPHA